MVRALRTVAVACILVALAGCGTAADANRSFGSGELIKDIATRLAVANAVTYTANFSLSDNATVTIAHAVDPVRTAYTFPGGLVLLLPDGTTTCKISQSKATCARGRRVAPGTDVTPALDSTIELGGMIRPETVISLLNQTALNADVIVTDSSRTLAGTNATCIAVTGVPASDQFSACVTADGLLGAFTGTVAGQHLDVELDQFRMTTDGNAFTVPTP